MIFLRVFSTKSTVNEKILWILILRFLHTPAKSPETNEFKAGKMLRSYKNSFTSRREN
jgi:hypothetical protein